MQRTTGRSPCRTELALMFAIGIMALWCALLLGASVRIASSCAPR